MVLHEGHLLPILSNLVDRLGDILVPLLNLVDHPLALLDVQYLLVDSLLLVLQVPSGQPVQVRSGPLLGGHVLDCI